MPEGNFIDPTIMADVI